METKYKCVNCNSTAFTQDKNKHSGFFYCNECGHPLIDLAAIEPLIITFHISVPIDNIIPEMTHPLSKGWSGPDRSEIQIDHQYARMKKSAFDKLLNYSISRPTAVYEGKMWKTSADKIHWDLHWWSASEDPDKCKDNTRKIIVHE